ncbi:hypothetical protein HQ45_01705 [Porphyromonas crevioricanis]|uniref:DNA recombination protein rmuC n=1 Tax=Porphyromonas crevioricanis TaxID=393921 RepID=A0A0A2FXV2_9PORP|nr:DNA recombination protein RmuC [Porphyromonas crevioricanis]KGN90857.1 hypothetical protein HQ45_01705 [Porphyromonas crevioricanis]KGN95022.1 hypothetical protein HQ38_04315 [Porphyromonas crevioricanis]SQH73249.1 DNA recombination protein rmuC [Porphyromonas crevioricanis]
MDLVFYILLFLFGITSLLLYLRLRNIRHMVDQERIRMQEQSERLAAEVKTKEESIFAEINKRISLETSLAKLDTERSYLQKEVEKLQNQSEHISLELKQEFELLSQRLLDSSATQLAGKQREELGLLFTPLREQLNSYRESMEKACIEQQKGQIQMGEQIRLLIEQTGKIGHDASDLAKALRGNSKIQGDWGEVVLMRLLEINGLREHWSYEKQQTVRTADGRLLRSEEEGKSLRPDVIVTLPENRQLVIDSKVSLTAYSKYYDCEDDTSRKLYLSEHIKSLRTHIRELSSKAYPAHLRQAGYSDVLDFTLLFVPIEGALQTAISYDDKLWEEAYKQQVMLVSPLQLIPVLKLVSDMWAMHKQQQNVQEIMDRVAKMYDKLVLVDESFCKVENSIEVAQKQILETRKRFSRGKDNLHRQFDQLVKLGVTPGKRLPTAVNNDVEEE